MSDRKKLTYTEVGRIALKNGTTAIVSEVNETNYVSIAKISHGKSTEGELFHYIRGNTAIMLDEENLAELATIINNILAKRSV